jgi:[acyl-carrier-protein] S-malonyltransferase
VDPVLAILCPGQGAQTAGFLAPWLDIPMVADAMRRMSTRAYVDLVRVGTDPDADVVGTQVAQPLLVAAGIAVARLLGPLPADSVVAGHSVGELTAAAVTGVLDAAAAVDLARTRGQAMAVASAETVSGMTAVLGGDPAAVEHAARSAGCWIANVNGAGQVVVAGEAPALARFAADPPPAARLRPLPVAGAFHTPLMGSAATAVDAAIAATSAAAPRVRLVSNADGRLLSDGAAFLRDVAGQVTRPVRFDRCLHTMRAVGVTATIELAPAGVLTGLVRRALPGVEAVALRTPDDLETAHRLLAHAVDTGPWTENWSLVVAPVNGTLARAGADGGVVVRNRAGDVPVEGIPRQVVEWLAQDGDLVAAGQPLARVPIDGAS